MKDIELPIIQTVSLTFKPHEIDMSKAEDMGNGQWRVHLGEIINPDISETIEQARINGGKVLYATTSIEHQLENLLLIYFMGPFIKHDNRRDMFEREILQSSAISYKSKKELVSKIINENDLLQGKKKNKLQGYLKKIMEWRNAFAHGKVQHDNLHGCYVKYYSGTIKELILNDSFWTELEKTFKNCSEMIKEAQLSIEKMDQDED